LIEKKELTGIYKYVNDAVPVLLGIYVFFVPIPHSTAIKEISFYLPKERDKVTNFTIRNGFMRP